MRPLARLDAEHAPGGLVVCTRNQHGTPCLNSVLESLRTAITRADTRYTRLVLAVGAPRVGKSALMAGLAAERRTEIVNLGLRLAHFLLDVPHRQRPAAAADRAADLVRDAAPLSIVDNIELLFNTGLRLDPLKLLQDCSRNHVVVATWPGSVSGNRLRFAVPPHPEFREYDDPDCELVELGKLSSEEHE